MPSGSLELELKATACPVCGVAGEAVNDAEGGLSPTAKLRVTQLASGPPGASIAWFDPQTTKGFEWSGLAPA